MSRLDQMLNRLAERGDPIGSDRLLERLDQELTGESTPDVVALDTRRRAMTTHITTKKQASWRMGPRLAIGLAAATVVVVAGVIAIAGLTSSDDAAVSPSETINAYVEAYNVGDIDAVMALFTEQSTIANHPSAARGIQGNPAVTGIEAIRNLHVADMAHAAVDGAYVFSNIRTAGSTVTWDHTWKSDEGLRGCGEGHEATVVDGRILSWTFGETGFC